MHAFLSALLALAAGAYAQVPPFQPRVADVALEYRYAPPHRLQRPRDGVPNDAYVRVRPYQIKTRLSRPWRISAWNGTLTTSFSYDYLKFEYENWDSAMDPGRVDELHCLQFMLGFNKRLNERWSLRLMGGPSINSDLKVITAKSARVAAMAGMEYNLADRRDVLGLGLAYVQVFGKNLVLPGISYQRRRDKYRVEFMAPMRTGAYWLPRKDLDLGMLLAFSGNNYRIEAPGELHGKKVEYSLGTVGPSVIWRAAPGVSGICDGGAVLRHRYALMDGREVYRNLDLRRSFFLSVGVRAGF